MPRVVGVRTQRHGPLILATLPTGFEASYDEFVLVEQHESLVLAQVALLPDQVLLFPPSAVTARVVAVDTSSREVVAALGQRNAAALATVRELCGESVPITDAAWSPDGARLTLTFQEEPPPCVGELRDRLASAFRAEIRFDWPGGMEESLLV
jgi:hypothetical protein